MRGSPCMSRPCTARTATTSPRAASRGWPGPCVTPWRWNPRGPDGFSWGAFLFSALWFFGHRLWVAGLAVLVAVIAFNALLAALDLRPWAGGLAEILFAVLIGLEANSLRRWTLERRGRPILDVVTARSRDEAELKALARSAEAP